MKVYLVNYCDFGSDDRGYGEYYDSMEKAIRIVKQNGFYRYEDGIYETPFRGRMMLSVGDFLLDVTLKWLCGGDYDDDDIWQPTCDFMTITEINVN
jgi:hypothetical protein